MAIRGNVTLCYIDSITEWSALEVDYDTRNFNITLYDIVALFIRSDDYVNLIMVKYQYSLVL